LPFGLQLVRVCLFERQRLQFVVRSGDARRVVCADEEPNCDQYDHNSNTTITPVMYDDARPRRFMPAISSIHGAARV
jgi:hypothetical protein